MKARAYLIGRRRVLRGLLAAGLALPAAAGSGWRAQAAALPPAAQPVAALCDALLAAMKAGGSESFTARAAALAPVVERVFDLPAILAASIGPRWAELPQASQAALLDAFTRFTVASWAANFNRWSGERFEVSPVLREVGADEVVESQLIPATGSPTRLDYQMREQGGQWKAVDVLVDGAISRVATQRSDFRSVLASGGPDKLLALLKQKADALAAGGGAGG